MAGEHLVHNERIKLRAALINGVAIAALVAAFVQALFFDVIGSVPSGINLVPLVLVLAVIGVALHLIAAISLGSLREKGLEEPTA
jgi:Na+/melibiose symporter-like transporter